MKKSIFLLLGLGTLAPIAQAKTVSSAEAKEIAMHFFQDKANTRSGQSEPTLLYSSKYLMKSVTRSAVPDNALYYVYGYSEGGFVIVSGDNLLYPILGYSYDSKFDVDNMPDPVKSWFSSIEHMVNSAYLLNEKPSDKVTADWSEVKTRGKVITSKALQTAIWDQGMPYNQLTPTLADGGAHCTTGCTNTATAIVMRYHEWPTAGMGTLPDYEYTKDQHRSMKGHALGHVYDWGNMPLDYNRGYTQEQGLQVAQLMYDVGVMNKAMYTPWYTDTDPANIPFALTHFMKYDKGVKYIERKDYRSNEEWENLIINEIDEGRPLLYAGNGTDGEGHCWVLDGYDDAGNFHMNWGWGGYSDGFYKITPMEETGQGLVTRHRMVIGIKPGDGTGFEDAGPSIEDAVTNFDFQPRTYFQYTYKILNNSIDQKDFQVRLAHVDGTGNVIKYISNEFQLSIMGYGTVEGSINCDFNSSLHEDDTFILYYLENGNWIPMTCTEKGIIRMKGKYPVEESTYFEYYPNSDQMNFMTERGNRTEMYYLEANGNKRYIYCGMPNDGTSATMMCEMTKQLSNGDPLILVTYNLVDRQEVQFIFK